VTGAGARRSLDARLGVALTLLLAIGVFQLILNDSMPKTGYRAGHLARPRRPTRFSERIGHPWPRFAGAAAVHRPRLRGARPGSDADAHLHHRLELLRRARAGLALSQQHQPHWCKTGL
jgi:hypothetical protein